MKRFFFAAASVILLVLTVGIGWLHGQMTNRWGPRPDARIAADRLKTPLPQQLGNWHRRPEENKFSDEVVRMLQCSAYVNQVYEHEQTGDVVSVAVIVGPPGPVAVHTPEICYSSRDYTITSARQKKDFQAAGEHAHTLWELHLKSNHDGGMPLQVFYAWSAGTTWEATEQPRFSFGGIPHLYKLQMSVASAPHPALPDFDPAQDFLTSFLGELQPKLVDSTRAR